MSDGNNNASLPGTGGNGQFGLLMTLLPKLPLVFKVIILHVLRRSETSKYLDLKSDVTISVLRSTLNSGKPVAIRETQIITSRDPGVKGKIWISTAVSQVPPEQGIRNALLAAIDGMRASDARGAKPSFIIPDIIPIEAEWTGYRAGATKDSLPPAVSEEEKYREMMKETKNKSTILFFHGGAYYVCDPITHRGLVKNIVKATGGRAYSVRYRLAPQNAFPSAVLDALVSYFTLLYPPPGSFHEAVAPSDIVISGDSAGGNLALALIRTVMEIRRQNLKIAWFGVDREVPLPAGVATISPWVDLVQSMPSLVDNQQWCYLPPPILLSETLKPKPDGLWPTDPPRRHLYVDDAYILHPLATLQMNTSWEGAPPMYVCCGWETIADEDRYLVSKLTRDGVTVVFEEYEAMPHVFVAVLPELAESHRNIQGIAKFIKDVCGNPETMKSSYTTIKAKSLEEVEFDVGKLSPFTDEQVWDMARRQVKENNVPQVPVADVPAKL
ncbi:alpha/beta hydrolase fold-domain-containing protein [Annulohypoxylon maeteangense]|uniref:alpha/beta hydrolase fold-domain-containing protein n=1 Tax=Annulohypoxylon maeteangense TaxID=1927788 RepID=UPI0020084BCF|nr:alpha/beta hydrolase fold-domain-containing protein [Annulohypoxylon maeteangense]KAI0887977.1 alpha/beta hydrolase fold-domain-containing protein [Annulohypoxylon maeteangense]